MRRFIVGLTLLSISILSINPSDSAWGQSSTNQQIESLQRQLDQLRAETGLPSAGWPVFYQQPAFPELAGVPTVPPLQPRPSAATAAAATKTDEKKYPNFKIPGDYK